MKNKNINEVLNLTLIELTPISFHIAIEIKIGRRKARMIVDTGASQTVISEDFTLRNHLETEIMQLDNITIGIGQDALTPKYCMLPPLHFGQIAVHNLPGIVLPMEHINSTYAKLGIKPIDGILGNDIIVALKVVINLKKMSMKLTAPHKKYNYEDYMLQMGQIDKY